MNAHLIVLSYIKPLSEVDRVAEAHLNYLRDLYENNEIFMSGRKKPRTGGVIMVLGKTKEEVETIVKLDPFCIEGIADFEIIEFEVGMWAKGLDSIMDSEA